MLKYIIRMDDICPRMNWRKFERVKATLDRYNIKPIIGVIPDNKDTTLMEEAPKANFWDLIRLYQANGWTIAQHGYEHLYHTKCGGIFELSTQGEFAGLSLAEQTDKLAAGRQILQQEGVESDIFMAPSHSIDWNTVAALKSTNFRYVTDGYALFPYEEKGLTFVPQLFESGLSFGFGIYTMCLHTNQMEGSQFDQLDALIAKNAAKFITFTDSYAHVNNGFLNTRVANQVFRWMRKGKSFVSSN